MIEVLFAVVEGGDREVAGGAIEGEDEVLDIVGVELGAEGFEEPAVEFLPNCPIMTGNVQKLNLISTQLQLTTNKPVVRHRFKRGVTLSSLKIRLWIISILIRLALSNHQSVNQSRPIL